MNKSDSIAKLAQALSKAQAEMPVVKMNAQNPFLKNKYADLGAVIETSRPVLGKFGLSVSQFPVSVGDRVGVTTILLHESGEWLEDTLTFSVTDSKGLSLAQSSGVVISYARRYSWASVLGLYADEDVDGHTPPAKAEEKSDEIVTDATWNAWLELIKQADAVKVQHKVFDRAKVKLSVLKETAKELREIVTNAQSQAKAGE